MNYLIVTKNWGGGIGVEIKSKVLENFNHCIQRTVTHLNIIGLNNWRFH